VKDWREGKPYRPNVGICLINQNGLVWFGKSYTAGPEIVSLGREWQMPQGGIEETEDIVEAAKRELWEETGATSVELIEVAEDWWTYDFPIEFSSSEHKSAGHKLDRFRGQKQRWVAFRFLGTDVEFNITADHTEEPQEFLEWRWLDCRQAIERTANFKIEQYKRVFNAFSLHLT